MNRCRPLAQSIRQATYDQNRIGDHRYIHDFACIKKYGKLGAIYKWPLFPILSIELHRVDEFGNHEILREMISFPVDVEGSYYEKGKRWAAENEVLIENIKQFCPIKTN